jgi:hypothetical protein
MIAGTKLETDHDNEFFDSGCAAAPLRRIARREDTVMKNGRKHLWLAVQMFVATVVLFLAAPGLLAQATTSGSSGSSGGSSTNFRSNPATNYNPPPCDYQNVFYNNVGISTSNVGTTAVTAEGVDSTPAQRFGLFRKTGPPAIFPGQVNWVIDNTCGTRDAVRNNVRILATTGGYIDSDGSPTDFINIMAFLTNQNFFESNYVNGDPAFNCAVPTPPTLPTSGCVVISNAQGDGSVNAGLNARNEPSSFFNNLPGNAGNTTPPNPQPQGDDMQDIVSNFEAYAAQRQIVNGVRTFQPCGTMSQPPGATTACFAVNNTVVNGRTISSNVATPNLSQDWRFATNRNAVDGSDNNVVNGAGSTGTTFFNAPYGYFCDDLLGMWIVTYFWYTEPPNLTVAVPGSQCQGPAVFQNGVLVSGAYAALAATNGLNLEGWPIVKSGPDLDNSLEAFTGVNGQGCAEEGNEDVGGADGGAVWLICPAIPDPTNGAISLDAFLDQVHRPNGLPLDPSFTVNFFCLQFFGQFCSNLTAAQVNTAQVQGAMAQVAASSAPAASTN